MPVLHLPAELGWQQPKRFFTDAEESAKYVEIEYRPNGVLRWKAAVSVASRLIFMALLGSPVTKPPVSAYSSPRNHPLFSVELCRHQYTDCRPDIVE